MLYTSGLQTADHCVQRKGCPCALWHFPFHTNQPLTLPANLLALGSHFHCLLPQQALQPNIWVEVAAQQFLSRSTGKRLP